MLSVEKDGPPRIDVGGVVQSTTECLPSRGCPADRRPGERGGAAAHPTP